MVQHADKDKEDIRLSGQGIDGIVADVGCYTIGQLRTDYSK